MPVKTKREIVAEFRAHEILNAAHTLFARKGFTATTMDNVAEEAGLAKGTLYLYFSSKREIYRKALHIAVMGVVEQSQKEMSTRRSIQQKIRAYIISLLKYAEEHGDFCKIYCQEFGNPLHPAAVDKELGNLNQRRTQVLVQVLGEARSRKEIRLVPPEATAEVITDMIRSLILRRLFAGVKRSIEEDCDFLCDMILKGIGV